MVHINIEKGSHPVADLLWPSIFSALKKDALRPTGISFTAFFVGCEKEGRRDFFLYSACQRD